jgi:hypothetical protein
VSAIEGDSTSRIAGDQEVKVFRWVSSMMSWTTPDRFLAARTAVESRLRRHQGRAC